MVASPGNMVVEYTYDSWGNTVGITGSMKDGLGVKNPFRYKGYYYDVETGFYYVSSRYYDPEVRRFLNADNSLYHTICGYNLFLYCNNNPISYYDPRGENATSVFNSWASSMWWLTAIDGILPIGDIIYIGTVAIAGVITVNNYKQNLTLDSTNVSGKVDDNGRLVVNPGQQPTKEDGYIAPKNGPIKGKDKKGKSGWKDKNDNIWVPAPTGSELGHGGGHWDVQSPKGGYINVYPGGTVRGGKPPYPKIPIFP